MPANTLENLKREYETLFSSMTVSSGRVDDADKIVDRIVNRRNVYEAIMLETGVPWQIIGVLHSMESNLNFSAHLHNGDPLTARTVRVPRGRPRRGDPPFTFAESAIDVLEGQGLAGLTDWGPAATLFRLEKYNGFGYRNRTSIKTPYLWSFSNHYTKGKFVEELVIGRFRSRFDPDLVSRQCGAAVLLRRMADREIFTFLGLPRPLRVLVNGAEQPAVSAFVQKGNSWIAPRPLVGVIPGFSLLAINREPFKITVGYEEPGGAGAELRTRDFPARMYQGKGYVDASDLVRGFLRGGLALDVTSEPDRLLVTL